MKKFIGITLVAVLTVLALVSCSSAAKPNPEGPTGKIVIYTSMYEDVIETLNWSLQRQFPNCQIELVYGGTGQLQARVAAEQASNRLGCDMLMVADPSYSLELKDKGMLNKYVSKTATNLAFDYDPDGYWYPVRVSNMVLAYNPDKYSKSSLPNSFMDFAADTSVKGAISMSNPLTSGTTLAAVIALIDKYGYGYFDTLNKQNINIESSAVALSKLETGEYKEIMVLEESVLEKREDENSKLEVIYPTDGVIMIPSSIMTIAAKWSANNNIPAAEVITDWFLGPEGQNAIVDGWMHSVRKNFRRIPFDSIPTSRIQAVSMPINWENVYREKTDILARVEQFLENRQ